LFNALGEEALRNIIKLEINKLVNRLEEKKYFISFDNSVLDEIIKRNEEEEYGARPIKRIIQSLCEDFLSDQILMGNIKENKPVKVVYKEKMVLKTKII
jgi:ATP-dependent Clp protease ATP-binding subunit ClpA